MLELIDRVLVQIGQPVEDVLCMAPIDEWPYERGEDGDLGPERTDFVFPDHGLDLASDAAGVLVLAFFYLGQSRRYARPGLEQLAAASRSQVIATLGAPEASGQPFDDPILGRFGGWTRFERMGHFVHVEYAVGADRPCKATLMRSGHAGDRS